MKKSLSITLISVLLIALFVSGTALAQEPEATEEVAVEVTEEATAEPTEEATAEPAEEATAEPTEEATAEPTEEVAVEPTEEPPTVEPTEEVLVETQDAGEIEASAVIGSWTSEYIIVQNLGSSPATVALEVYNPNGSSAGSLAPTANPIPVGGNSRISISSLSDGQYAGIVSSDVDVAAAVLNVNSAYQGADIYLGSSSAAGSSNPTASTLYCPNVLRDHVNWTSKFYIQDASGSSQTVQINAYLQGASTPAASPTYPLAANGSVEVDFMSSDFNAFGSGDGFHGYAEIVGEGPLAVVCENIKDDNVGPNRVIQAYHSGLSSAQSGRNFVVPILYNRHLEWKGGVNIVNLGSIATTVHFTYTISSQYGGGVQYRSIVIGPNAKNNFYLPQQNLRDPSYGSIAFSSTDTDILAASGTNKVVSAGSSGFMVPPLNPDLATNNIAAPVEFRQGSGNWNGGLNVYSVGSAGTITTRWVRADADPTNPANYFEYSMPGVNNGAVTFFSANLPGMLSNFTGSVYVESSSPIVAYFGASDQSGVYNYQAPGYNYSP